MTMATRVMKWTALATLTLLTIVVLVSVYLTWGGSVQSLPDNHGQVEAELFVGQGINQPLLVGLGGAEGGNAWASDFWAAQRDEFIAQGYAFLAIGYFGAANTPQELDRIALEGIHDAILEAASDPAVNSQCVALIGGSKGAEGALLLASEYPDIDAVVAMVPGSAVFAGLTMAMNTSSFSLHGEPLDFVPVPWSATPALIKGDLRAAWVEMMKNEDAMETAAIKVENINGPIFFVSATRDEFWPSTEMSRAMEQRLEDLNFPYYVEHLAVEGDHASVLNHFDKIEIFLREQFLDENSPTCSR
jgi:pimeloyl-ACP methyl ester carboxylesterase